MKKQIYLSILFLYIGHFAQAKEHISGTIKNKDNETVIYATVEIKDQKIFAISDERGHFKIEIPDNYPFTLKFTYVGYATKELIVSAPISTTDIILEEDNILSEVTVTARRREETVQQVPIPMSVIGGKNIDESGAFNVNRIKEIIPTVQLYSSNPRNTSLNIRGLGSTFGLTNDGIDPGVGFYIDGVYYARPAVSTLDFVDVERIEVLRGPQGTLFGKNTTAGAFNITTRKPSFNPAANFEASYGNYGYIQAKASITGPLSKKIAGRISFVGTQRDGTLYNISTQKHTNEMNNLATRGQLLFLPTHNLTITLSGDYNRQRPDGFAQVVAGVVKTQRADYRQFDNIIKDLNYELPSKNPFDRIIDHNTSWRSDNDLGGASVNIDLQVGPGTLTSTTSWRFWNWNPSNDRDFTGLPILTLSQAPSKHKNWTQEIRYVADINKKVKGVIGAFFMGQNLKTDSVHTEESGAAQWRFSQNTTSPLWQTPDLLNGYGIKTKSLLETFTAAVFGQFDWELYSGFHLLSGIRYNYDRKYVDYNRTTYGGLQTEDPALIALKNSVYNNQAFEVKTKNHNVSGQATISYQSKKRINGYAIYALSYKPIGLNLGGLPIANGQPMLELAEIKPEKVNHIEIGVKSNPTLKSTLNLSYFNSSIKDYQTLVQSAELGVNRGYLANAEKVRVQGVELDANYKINKNFSFFGNFAYTDGKYLKFTNAPVPLEEVGGKSAFKDISGGLLPGISKITGSFGGEGQFSGNLIGLKGNYFLGIDTYFRSKFSSSASPSEFLNIDGYALLNARAGFRASNGLSLTLWGRNLTNKDYFEQLLPASGSAGHYAAVLGDPLTYGITLKYTFIKSTEN